MAVTYGFYNSLNGDRKYYAEQMSSIFNGIITDGVFSSIGDALMTVAGSATSMQVIVKTGRAWFNGTWTQNDAQLPLDISAADVSLPRIDAVVLEVNNSNAVRANSIKIVKGTASANPQKPTLTDENLLHQYALAYVTVPAGASSISASNIEVNVGKTGCPFITSVLQQADITDVFNQWEAEFDEWFANVKSTLSGDAAANLQKQIDERVKISDKATVSDIENEIPGKWVDSAMIGGAWSIGDLKISRRASLGKSWGVCDGSLVNASKYPKLADWLQSQVGLTNYFSKCTIAFPNTVSTSQSNMHTRRPTHTGTILYSSKNSSGSYTLCVQKTLTGESVDTGIAFSSNGINCLSRKDADNLYYFRKSDDQICIVDADGELVSTITVADFSLPKANKLFCIDSHGSIFYAYDNDSSITYYGALNAIDFTKKEQTITTHSIYNMSSKSNYVNITAIVGEYAYWTYRYSGSSNDRTYYCYIKLATTSGNGSPAEIRIDGAGYPDYIANIIPIDDSHMLFEYYHNSSGLGLDNRYYDFVFTSIGDDTTSNWKHVKLSTGYHKLATYFDGTIVYIICNGELCKITFNISDMIANLEEVSLPKMPEHLYNEGELAIANDCILFAVNNEYYAYSTGLIAKPLLTNSEYTYFIKIQ